MAEVVVVVFVVVAVLRGWTEAFFGASTEALKVYVIQEQTTSI
jgi:hypothetical protein